MLNIVFFIITKLNMLKILILGSSGLLGNNIYREIKKNKKISLFHTGLTKRKFNLTNKIELQNLILSIKPDLIINTIGLTDIEICEKKNKISKEINYGIIQKMFDLKKKKKLNFKLIHISTDQLYNLNKNIKNSEKSKIFLANNYCKHKRAAEIICLKNKALIFRTNFFGKSFTKSKSFTDWVFNKFKNNKKFYLFNDVYFNPLRIKSLVKIISTIINKRLYINYGLYNLGSKDAIYKNQFAILFAKKVGIYKKNYSNINVNKLLKVKRSTNMFMDVNKFEKIFNLDLPSIKSEIINEAKEYIKS
jgi:dTDP-4-dehydrorhamnose reductase